MAASFRQLKQYQEVSFFSLPFLFFTLPFRMERNTSQRKKLCSLILMFWGWMYCDWWKAYKCWMTERIETMIRMNCTFVFAFTYVSMYTNTMSKELFGVSQRGDGSTNNFFFYQFSHDIAKEFRDLNSMWCVSAWFFFVRRVTHFFFQRLSRSPPKSSALVNFTRISVVVVVKFIL